MNFSHLSPTDFEDLCRSLLDAMAFRNIDWRKGSPRDASPADAGRDIECDLPRTDIDGRTIVEHWFVECKHYDRAVPPAALAAALAWAAAMRPTVLLFICSGYLSNACKDHLAAYARHNAPLFRIKFWENTDLERLLADKSSILSRFGLSSNADPLHTMNPAHVQFLQRPIRLTLNQLFARLDKLSDDLREEALRGAYAAIIRPSIPDNIESLAHAHTFVTATAQLSYDNFKRTCAALPLNERFLAGSILYTSLTLLFTGARLTGPERAQRIGLLLDEIEGALSIGVTTWANMSEFWRQHERLSIGGFDTELLTKLRDTLRAQMHDGAHESMRLRYEDFCREALVPLMHDEATNWSNALGAVQPR